MTRWAFRQYVTDWGEWPFRDWYNRQAEHVMAAFDFTRRFLEDQEDWIEPEIEEFRLFDGPHAPLGEMRFRADDRNSGGRVVKKRRIRPVGFLRPEHRDFVLFGAGEERRNGTYEPANTMDRALRLFRSFQEGRGEIYEVD